jgi:peptide/nickel transport system substrate-binding protein
MKKRLSILALVLAVMLSIPACSSKTAPGDSTGSNSSTGSGAGFDYKKFGVEFTQAGDAGKSPKVASDRTDTLVVGIPDSTGIYNILYGDNAYDWYAIYTMFDFNIDVDFDGKAIPGATDYTVSDDGLTYTFKIKDGVKFWDGNPATASDLEFAYYLEADPNYDGPADISKAFIKGLDAYKKGSAEKIEGLKVIDEKTLQITVDKPSGPAIYTLQVPLLEKNYYGANFKKGDTAKVKEKNGAPMGTGQYKFVEYKAGQELKLAANENYFKGAPKIKNLVFSVTPTGQELQRVIAGETDVDMADVSPDNMKAAKDAGFIDIYRYPTNGYGYVGFNDANSKFSDVKVRQALMYALNRAAVVQKVYGEYARVVNIPESNVGWAYNDEGCNTYEFNLEKAGQLLDEAGWKLNSNGKREKDGKLFTIKFTCMSPHPVTDIMVPVMKDDYAKLGIDVTVENLDWPTLYEKATKKQLEAYFMASGLTPDPDASLANAFKSDAPQNYYNYKNSEVDKLCEKGLNEISTEKRKPIYKEIYKILNNDLPILYVYQRSDMWVANARIKNYELSSFREFFYNLYKAEIGK